MPPTKVQHGFFSLQNAKGKLSDSCAKYSNIACHKQTRLATNKHNLLQITSLCYKSPRLATNHLALLQITSPCYKSPRFATNKLALLQIT